MFDAASIEALLHTPGETRDRIGEPYPFGNEKRREVTTTWEVGPGNTDPDSDTFGDDGTIELSLTTYHYGDRKEYSSTLRVSINCGSMTQTTMSFGLNGESAAVHREHVARFSAKTMREHHVEARRLVEAHADHLGSVLQQGVAQYLPKAVAS